MPSPSTGSITMISIHAPLTGSDLSRMPGVQRGEISIHAPLTGSDSRPGSYTGHRADFNPRSPYGERPSIRYRIGLIQNFNPRSPYGERQFAGCTVPRSLNFNPRSPYGERRASGVTMHKWHRFQSTLPLRGATGHRWWK